VVENCVNHTWYVLFFNSFFSFDIPLDEPCSVNLKDRFVVFMDQYTNLSVKKAFDDYCHD
jgi:hypothetical protein